MTHDFSRRDALRIGLAGLFYGARASAFADGPDLDRHLRTMMERARAPGLSAAVVRDGRVVWARGYGLADRERRVAVTPDTLFITASVSKPAVAMAAMQLVDEGRIGLDDDVSRHLPFAVRHPAFPRAPITLRRLLTHTAGIGDSGVEDSLVVPGDSPISLAEFMRGYFTPQGRWYDADENFTETAPGAAYAYSNLGVTLAGYVIEAVSGEEFSARVRRSLFAPLGMRASGWRLAEVDRSRCALPYSWSRRRGFYTEGHYGFPDVPDGALRSTASEYAKLLVAMMTRGAGVLRPATVREMCREQFPSIAPGQGLGWFTADDDDDSVLGHNGAYIGASTEVLFDRARNVGVVVLTNGPAYMDERERESEALSTLTRELLRDA
jgi:CubicO group peptidase (beta-lactamase class C family)